MLRLFLSSSLFLIITAVTSQPALQVLDMYENDITGKTITIYTDNPLATDLKSHVYVKNSGEIDLSVYVRRIVNSAVSQSTNGFCFGVNCYPPLVDTSQVETRISIGEINTTFEGDYYPNGGRGISSITYEFYDITTTAIKVAASVTVLYAVADVIELFDEEDHLVNNSTIVVHSTDTSQTAYMDTKVKVKNNTSAELTMFARRIDNSVVPGTMNTFCFGVCYPPDVDTSTVEVKIPGGATDENFLADYYPNGHAGATSLSFEFFDNVTLGAPVTANVTIIFNLSGVGLPDNARPVLVEPYPNPASEFTTFSYELPVSAKTAYLSIRNLPGTEVESIILDRASGKAIVNTSGLPAGIYLYSLIIDGKVSFTKKLIINH